MTCTNKVYILKITEKYYKMGNIEKIRYQLLLVKLILEVIYYFF